MYSIVYRTFLDKVKASRNKVAGVLPETVGTESFEDRQHLKLMIDQMEASLKEEERQLFVLRFRHDLSVRETADIMNLTEAAVKLRVHRLRDKIKRLFAKGGERVEL